MHKLDKLEIASPEECILDRLRAALGSGPGSASDRPDSPPGTIARVKSVWGSLTFGGKLEILEAADRATCLSLWQDLTAGRNAPRIVEV